MYSYESKIRSWRQDFPKKIINVNTCIFGSIEYCWSHLAFLSFVSWQTLETVKEESRVSSFMNFLFWWYKIKNRYHDFSIRSEFDNRFFVALRVFIEVAEVKLVLFWFDLIYSTVSASQLIKKKPQIIVRHICLLFFFLVVICAFGQKSTDSKKISVCYGQTYKC